ncbi:hypothetical protein YC2023_057649 [Brassica napus]
MDSPDLLGTTSLLCFYHTKPSQASTVLHRIGSTALLPLSSWPQLPQRLYDTSSSHRQIYYTRVWTRQIYSSRLYGPPTPFLVAVTIVQECGYA